jgi:dienelactone hydrolase
MLLRLVITAALVVFSLSCMAMQNEAPCPFSAPPPPTGKFAVGTFILPLQRLASSHSARKVQLWYPAALSSRDNLIEYVPDRGALAVLRSQKFLDQPPCVFDAWGALRPGARNRARFASQAAKFPLVVISPGAGMPRVSYTLYAQQLASDGFIVATVDYGTDGFLVDEGKLLNEGDNEVTEAAFAKVAQDWALHISEIVDEMSGKRPVTDTLEREISRHVDTARIAAMGHSLGGEASLIACEMDTRLRACVDADGGLDGSKLAETGLTRSALVLHSRPLYSDADLARRHRTREEFEAIGKKAGAQMHALIARPGDDAWVLSISGTGHLSFSDAPYTMPTTISRFGGTIIDPRRLFTIVIDLIESYFQHGFDPSKPFPIDKYPEVTPQVSRVAAN